MRSGALALGFLTGINLCPPFLVAGLRAAQLEHLSAALLFFRMLLRWDRNLVSAVSFDGLRAAHAGGGHRGPHGGCSAGLLVWIFRSFHPDREDMYG
jgi:hypothetical protein